MTTYLQKIILGKCAPPAVRDALVYCLSMRAEVDISVAQEQTFTTLVCIVGHSPPSLWPGAALSYLPPLV